MSGMRHARAEQRRTRALDDAVVIDGVEQELRRFEEAGEPAVVILVRVGDDRFANRDLSIGMRAQIEAPAEEAQHVVRLAGIDEHELIVWRDDERAVSLTDVDEIDLEQLFLLEISLPHPSRRAPRSYLRPLAVVFIQQRDEVAPDQLLSLRSIGQIVDERRGITRKSDWHGWAALGRSP